MSFIVIQPIPSGDEFLIAKIGMSESNGNIKPDEHQSTETAFLVADSVRNGRVIHLDDFQPFMSKENLQKITISEAHNDCIA